ncbi:MAG: hypothetical protein JOY71_10140 [Acetobacteraceae bacterium]|nr:hypothetical protein [Acetobacteraceae bacterium]MBV8522463.1 hypothetical protein [Acetobacteraceae bacterium]
MTIASDNPALCACIIARPRPGQNPPGVDQKPPSKLPAIVIARKPKPRPPEPKPEQAKALRIVWARKPLRKSGYYRKKDQPEEP